MPESNRGILKFAMVSVTLIFFFTFLQLLFNLFMLCYLAHKVLLWMTILFINIKEPSFSFPYEMWKSLSNLFYNKLISFLCGLPSSAHCFHSIL